MWQKVNNSGVGHRSLGQHGVTFCHDSQVSVQCILAVQHYGSGTGAVEGSGDFRGDVFGFTHADDDDFPTFCESFT